MPSPTRPKIELIAVLCAALLAPAASADDGWEATLTPYLLLPGVEAKLRFDLPAGDPEVEEGPSEVLALINMAAMLKGEARNGRLIMMFDWLYIDLGDVQSVLRDVEFPDGTVPVNASVMVDSAASFDGFAVLLAGGMRLLDEPSYSFDAYGGVRTLNLSAAWNWTITGAIASPGNSYSFASSGEVEDVSENWDALLGVRGRWQFGAELSAFGVADHGWGDGSSSWQWALGLGWQRGQLGAEIAWRELGWRGIGAESVGELRLYGPAFGVSWAF